METKKVILPTSLITTKSPGNLQMVVGVSSIEGLDIQLHLVDEVVEDTVYLERPNCGDLVMQEFWDSVSKKVFFDINTSGELIAIFPNGFDGFINEQGELIIVEGTIEYIAEEGE